MLSILDDDCLLIICKYLDVYDHIAIANTTPHLGSIVQEFYRSSSIETTCEFWQYREEHENLFNEFWNLISINLQKLIFEPKEEQHINLLKRCNFPNLRYFSFSLWNLDLNMPTNTLKEFLEPSCMNLQNLKLKHIYWKDFQALQHLRFPKLTHMELLTKYYIFKREEEFVGAHFPQLTTLILNSVASGQGLWTFTNLTELVLEKCTRLTPKHVEQILLKLPLKKLTIICTLDFHNDNCNNTTMQNCYKAISQCQTLEELSVDYHYFCMFNHELLRLSKLRKLNFLPPSYCLCSCKARPMTADIAMHFGKATKNLTLKLAELTENWHALQTFIRNSRNVQCLKIIYTRCKSDHIRTFAEMLSTNLKEFHFHGVLEWSGTRELAFFDYSGLLNVLKHCVNLKVFDFSETYCKESFLEQALETVRNNFGDRKSPLLLRFNQAPIEMNNLKKLDIPDFVKISNERFDYNWTAIGIQCEW